MHGSGDVLLSLPILGYSLSIREDEDIKLAADIVVPLETPGREKEPPKDPAALAKQAPVKLYLRLKRSQMQDCEEKLRKMRQQLPAIFPASGCRDFSRKTCHLSCMRSPPIPTATGCLPSRICGTQPPKPRKRQSYKPHQTRIGTPCRRRIARSNVSKIRPCIRPRLNLCMYPRFTIHRAIGFLLRKR